MLLTRWNNLWFDLKVKYYRLDDMTHTILYLSITQTYHNGYTIKYEYHHMVHANKMECYLVATLFWNSQWPPQACTQDEIITKLMLPITIRLVTLYDVEISLSLSSASLQQGAPRVSWYIMIRYGTCIIMHASYSMRKYVIIQNLFACIIKYLTIFIVSGLQKHIACLSRFVCNLLALCPIMLWGVCLCYTLVYKMTTNVHKWRLT